QPTQTSRSVILSTEGNYRQVHSGDVKIYENLSVLPHAFIVHQVEVVEDDEQAIAAMKNPRFDPRQKLVLLRSDDTAAGSIQTGHPSDQDEATVLSYEPERIVIKANLESSGWLFLADTYYPGWQATVDDRPVEIFQANVLFRGVPVPAGEHVVEFEFTPRSFRWGVAVTGVTLLLTIAGLVAIATKWAVRRR
ncbi:MAG: YfhO family protein, partial [Anaerolineae bacterium]|nr:YfhO family protein [Anaerolineae bacterium]